MQATRYSLVLAIILLAGCSTGGGPVGIGPLGSGPLGQPPDAGNAQTSSNVSVYRDTASTSDLFGMVFTINGEDIYQLRPNDRYDFQLAAGSYEFGYRLGPASSCTQFVQIDPRGNYVFKLGSDCTIELESQ